MRRVVVTGLGIVSPLGRGVEHNWKSLLAGKSGIRKIEDVDLKDIPVTIAGQVPWGTGENEFNPDTVMAPKDQKKNDKFILYGMAAGGAGRRRMESGDGQRRGKIPCRRYDGFRYRRFAGYLRQLNLF